MMLAAAAAGCVRVPRVAAGLPADAAVGQVMSAEAFDHALLSRAIFEETNRIRVAHGKMPLVHLAALDAAADEQATYMALSLAPGHSNPVPGLRNAAQRVAHQGVEVQSVGENAIMMPARRPPDAPDRDYTYGEYAAYLLVGWMNSPEHRDTLLAGKFTQLGCAARLSHGVAEGDLRVFAIQVFLLPQPQPDQSLVHPGERKRLASPPPLQ